MDLEWLAAVWVPVGQDRMGSSETEPAPEGSGETEPAPKGSGKAEHKPKGSGEMEPAA